VEVLGHGVSRDDDVVAGLDFIGVVAAGGVDELPDGPADGLFDTAACLNTTLPGNRRDRLDPKAVVGVTVHARARVYAAGPARAALLP
jgi:hypothetical protein